MAHQIGYVDNTGSEGLAHWQMLDTIRRFACGFGTLAAPAFVGTGNGTLGALDSHPDTVAETWTITCTSAATAGAEIWSVVGSVSGAKANATTGVAYDNTLLVFTIAAGATNFAVNDAFTVVAAAGALDSAHRWAALRYLTPTDGSPRELILKGVGLSGTEQIYIGFRCYHSVSADYYNMACAVFTGYVAANTWETQPGMHDQALCAHNQRIDYWLAVNAQRIMLGMKVGTPVYEVGYAGKFYPYATPGQYPYPVVVIGTLGSRMPATRYSDLSNGHTCGCKGLSNGYLRDLTGTWQQFRTMPWTADLNNAPTTRRDTGGYYSALKTVLMTGSANNPGGSGNVWGELDGLRYVSGFNNLTENTMTVNTVLQVMLQDVFRTGIGDYMLLEMN